jgi:hypothetical protein
MWYRGVFDSSSRDIGKTPLRGPRDVYIEIGDFMLLYSFFVRWGH